MPCNCNYLCLKASYLCLETGRIHSCLVTGKSLKYITTASIKLVAATPYVKISALLKRELQMNCDKKMFWISSKVTLGYIRNESKTFKTFTTKRNELI